MSGTQILADKTVAKGGKTLSEDNNVNVQMEQLRGKTNVLTRTVESMNSKVSEVYENTHVLLPGNWYPNDTILPCENLITNLRQELYTEINQTATSITTEVNNVSDQLNSKIEQTAISINATVEDLAANTSAQFSIASAEISSKVEKDGIISSINQSAESVTINANKINLVGYVTITDLEVGNINVTGSCIVGTLTGNTISGATISGGILTSSNSSNSTTIESGVIRTSYIAMEGYFLSTDGGSVVATINRGAITCKTLSINGYSPITTNNIGSQSVSYASSANSASSASTASTSYRCATGYLTMSSGTIEADSGSLYIGQNSVKANTITQTSSRKKKKYIKD